MLIQNADRGGETIDLRIERGQIAECAPRLTPRPEETILDAMGGAVLPGLHDHHLHLMSLAASLDSVMCGPPDIETQADLESALRAAAARRPGEWIRGTGYFESVAGPLDRDVLDRLVPQEKLRIQHRSGAAWILNSPALEALGITDRQAQASTPNATSAPTPSSAAVEADPPGLERDASGRASGRLFRLDDWMRGRLPTRDAPDLAVVGRHLARWGVTGVTDATPTNGPEEVALFRAAQASGALPQHLMLMGDRSLESVSTDERLRVGAHKILLDDARLPDFERLVDRIRGAHEARRAVAIHTVTRGEMLFALAAIEAVGAVPGDRLEHASVTPPEALEAIGRLGLRIITQPNFVRERGDAYLRNVEAIDQSGLYRLRDWLDTGVPLAGGTDAPFGDPDPWKAMRAAVDRRTEAGHPLGLPQALSPEEALGLFTSPADAPGGPNRPVGEGAPADLCLLDRPWRAARKDLDARQVRATLIGGQVAWDAHR